MREPDATNASDASDPGEVSGVAPVASPCISVCTMNSNTGWCDGCLRTIDEIAAWSQMDDRARRAVCDELMQRRTRLARLAGD